MNSLTIILPSNRPENLCAWFSRHHDVLSRLSNAIALQIVVVVDGYFNLDQSDKLNIDILQMPGCNVAERLIMALEVSVGKFVMLSADDDTLMSMAVRDLNLIRGEVAGIVPETFFQYDGAETIHPANTNQLNCESCLSSERLSAYFTPIFPGDNSVCYGIYERGIFTRAAVEQFGNRSWDFIGNDWLLVCRILLKGKIIRTGNLKVIRHMTCWAKTMSASNDMILFEKSYDFLGTLPMYPLLIFGHYLLEANSIENVVDLLKNWNAIKHEQYLRFFGHGTPIYDRADLDLLFESTRLVQTAQGPVIRVNEFVAEYFSAKRRCYMSFSKALSSAI